MAPKRKVLFVNGSSAIEGDTRVLINTARSLDRGRFQCFAVTTRGAAADELRALFDVGVAVSSVGPAGGSPAARLAAPITFAAGLAAVLSAIRRWRPDIVYTYDRTRAVEVAFLAAKLSRRKLLFHAHYPFALSRRARRFIATHADRIVVISDFVGEQCRKAGYPMHKVVRVWNGIDADAAPVGAAAGPRAGLGIAEGAPVIGMVGRLSPFKGQEDLLRAASLIRADIPELQVLIAGHDTTEAMVTHGPHATSYKAILEGMISDLGLDGCVRLVGFAASASDVYRAADVVAVPSHAEPFGLVIVEAMLASKPVVACSSGGAPEIITDGETGLLVPPQSPQQLAAALCRLLRDQALARRLAERGKERATTDFNLARYARDVGAVLDAL